MKQLELPRSRTTNGAVKTHRMIATQAGTEPRVELVKITPELAAGADA